MLIKLFFSWKSKHAKTRAKLARCWWTTHLSPLLLFKLSRSWGKYRYILVSCNLVIHCTVIFDVVKSKSVMFQQTEISLYCLPSIWESKSLSVKQTQDQRSRTQIYSFWGGKTQAFPSRKFLLRSFLFSSLVDQNLALQMLQSATPSQHQSNPAGATGDGYNFGYPPDDVGSDRRSEHPPSSISQVYCTTTTTTSQFKFLIQLCKIFTLNQFLFLRPMSLKVDVNL